MSIRARPLSPYEGFPVAPLDKPGLGAILTAHSSYAARPSMLSLYHAEPAANSLKTLIAIKEKGV
ncbi:MAG: hypothetical protein ACRET2_07460, partial [Steroidobacteraceae bacterium]